MGTVPTNLQLYAAAVFPDGYSCLGRRLQPLCIGHVLLLLRLESPFLTGSRIPDCVDIGLAVEVCRRRWDNAAGARDGWWFRICFWTTSILAWTRPKALAAFTNYLERSFKGPDYWRDGATDGKEPRTPFWLAVQATLMRDLGFTNQEALSMPISAALWICAAIWEGNGSIRLESEMEREVKAEAASREVADA